MTKPQKNIVLFSLLLFAVLIASVLILTFAPKQNDTPKNTSEKMYELGIAALETVDEYLDGIISLDDAIARMSRTGNAADAQYDRVKEDVGSDSLVGSGYSNDFFISHNIVMLGNELFMKDFGTSTTKDVIEKRNDLAKYLNEKLR